MRRNLTLAALFFCASGLFAQTTYTPNINLGIPAYQSTNWQIPLNADLSLLDSIIGGSAVLPTGPTPAISQQANWITSNISTTTITNFTGGLPHQTLRLLCGTGDTFTSIANSATISVASTWSCSSSLSISLVLNGTVWTEFGRSGGAVGGGGAFVGGLGNSFQDVTGITTPTNPASGNYRLYLNSSTNLMACLTSAGANCLPLGGTVTSVGLSVPSWLTVTNSPVIASGVLTVAPTNGQTAHQVIGTCGSATSFAPCSLVAGDIPTLNQNTTGSAASLSSTLACGVFPALTGDVTTTAGSCADTLATVNSNVGTFTIATITVNAKGLITAASSGSAVGTVTTFSAGSLSPLFTSSVATATTTPALTFTLSNAAQNSVFAGPATGGAGAPSFQTGPTISAANMTNFPTFNQNTTGSAASLSTTLACGAHPALTGDVTNTVNTCATTVGKLENLTLPTLGGSTGVIYDTAGVLSLTNAPPLSAANFTSFPTLNQNTTGNAGTATALSSTGSNGTFWGVASGTQQWLTVTPTGGTVIYTSTQTASTSDNGKLVLMNCSSPCSYALPTSQPSTTWFAGVMSIGSTTATITLGGSDTFNGTTTVPVLIKWQVMPVYSNTATATDYEGNAPLIAGTNITFGTASNGLTLTASASGATGWPSITGSATNTNTGFVLAPSNTSTVPWTTNCPSGITVDCTDFELNSTKEVWITSAGVLNTLQVPLFNGNAALYSTEAAGGDLSGTYPNPTVAQIEGAAIPVSAFFVGTNASKQLVADQPFVVNPQTTTYQVVAADFIACKTITVASGTFTITLVASGSQPATGQCINIFNYGTGVITVARSGQTINGAAANLTLNAASASNPTSVNVVSDGTNYYATLDEGTVGTVTSIATTGPITGGTITGTGTVGCATCVTSSGGGAMTATAPVTVSAAGLIAITGVTGEQGNGVLLQLSTGTVNSGRITKFDANGNTINSDFLNSTSNVVNSPTTTQALTYQGGQDASANSALGGVTVRGANQTGAGGSSSAGGPALLAGGNNAATNAASAGGSVESLPGASTGATQGLQGLNLQAVVYVKGGGTSTQWNLQCGTGAAMTVNDCGASPNNWLGAAEVVGSNVVQVGFNGEMPVNASAAVTLNHTVCAGPTPGKVTDSAGTATCSNTQGSTVGVVLATSGTWTLPDGTSFTATTTLPLIQMNTAAVINTSGGGSGTVNNCTTATAMAYYSVTGTAISCLASVLESAGTITLGISGTTVGNLIFQNATSGSTTLAPVTGALGSTVLLLPTGNATIATSVTVPSFLSPAATTSSGVIAITLANEVAFTVFGNATGSSATPTFTTNPAVSSLTLEGATSGSAILNVTATGGTLNLGSTHATATSAGGITDTNETDSALTQDVIVYAGAGGLLTGIAPPTVNSSYSCGYIVTASAAVAPTCNLPGVPIDSESGATYSLVGQSTGSTTPATDRATLLLTTNVTTSTAVTVAQAGSTGFTSNYPFVHCNTGTVVATDTPTTSTVNGNAALKLVGAVAGNNPECAFWWSDNTNWWSAEILPTDANGRLQASGFPVLTGDVTNTAGTLAITVTQVEGLAVPTSALLLGTNSSKQLVTAALANTDIYVGNGSNLPAAVAVTGDVSLTNAGVVTVTQVEGAAIPVSAFFVGTNASKQLVADQPFVPNPKTTTYQVVAADFNACKTIPVASGTFTITLVASGSQPAAGQCIYIVNYGTGVVTVARSGQNINGAAANLTLSAGSSSSPTGVFVFSDGTNYEAQIFGASGGGAVTSVSGDGTIITNSGSAGNVTLTIAGNSGGIPYFSSSSAWNSSAALTQYGVVFGGGAGGAPTSSAQGGTNFPLVGQGAANPIWSTVSHPSSATAGGLTYASSTTALAVSGALTGIVRGGNPPTAAELSGDVTTSGSNAATVVQVEGAAIPASAFMVGTNSSKQLISTNLFVPNAQTTTYQVLAADFNACKTIPVASGTFTITLVASGSQPPTGQCVFIVNYGSGVVTVARSGQNINGAAANLTLSAGSASSPTGVFVFSDGTNYEAQVFGAGGGGTTTNALTGNNGGAGAASGSTFNGSGAVTFSYNTFGAAPTASPTFTGTVTTPLTTAGLVTTSSGGVLSSEANCTIAQGCTNATSAAAGTVPNATSGTASTWTSTVTLGVSGTAGTLATFPASGNFTTTWGSAATASNTILGFATAPTTGDVIKCVTSTTTCTLTDTGILAANIVIASSPGAGIARFAGSTQTVTSAELSGDVTTSGSNAATVVQVEGAAIPVSAFFVGTNSSKQLIADQPFVVNPQTTTYQVVAADFVGCKTITVASGTFTITLVASGTQPATGQCVNIYNYGSGVVTVARSGQNINGAAGNLTLSAGSATAPTNTRIVSDGTNYFATLGGTAAGGTPAYPLTITGGVSGGVVYGSSATQLTVSPAGTANVLMKWGGAGAAPTNSSLTDNGTTVATAEEIVVTQTAGTGTALAILNSTAATSSTSQSSPFDVRTGTGWYNPDFDTVSPPLAAVSANDCWSHQVVVAGGSNGASTYQLSHNGVAGCIGMPAQAELFAPYSASYGVATLSISNATAPTVALQGSGTGTTWTYAIVACVGQGCAAVGPTTGTVGPTTINGTNWMKITWAAVTGADYYQVYRTAASGAVSPTSLGDICLIPAGATLECDDKGLTGDATTAQVYNASGQVYVGAGPKVGGGTGGGMFSFTGTAPTTLVSSAAGWYANASNTCLDVVNGTSDVGCAAALGAVESFTVAQTFTGGIINTTTPIRDQTNFVLVANMTAVSTAGVNIGSTGAGNSTFSWPVTAANWYNMSCKLPVTFVASATIRFELVSISGSVTISNVNSETMGNTGAAAAFQDLTTIAGTTLAGSETPVTGAPGGVSETVTFNAQFLTSHAGNIGLEFVANGTNNVTMLLGGQCSVTQTN